ncbi:hypothetical protein LINPERPRIM_LOCUS8637, partial [Linum perenne]
SPSLATTGSSTTRERTTEDSLPSTSLARSSTKSKHPPLSSSSSWSSGRWLRSRGSTLTSSWRFTPQKIDGEVEAAEKELEEALKLFECWIWG